MAYLNTDRMEVSESLSHKALNSVQFPDATHYSQIADIADGANQPSSRTEDEVEMDRRYRERMLENGQSMTPRTGGTALRGYSI